MVNYLETGKWYTFQSNALEIYIAQQTREWFLGIPEWISQRDTLARSRKQTVIDALSTLLPDHHIVVVGELTADDEWEGISYKKGSIFTLDGNTRSHFWSSGLTDELPENVLAVNFIEDSFLGIRNRYWCYDSPSATVQTQEVITGLFKSINFNALTVKFKKAQIVTSLSNLCKYHDPSNFGKDGIFTKGPGFQYKRSQTQLAVTRYIDTIRDTDKLLSDVKYTGAERTGTSNAFDQVFIAALFLHYQKYRGFSDKIIHACKIFSESLLDENGDVVSVQIPSKGKRTATQWIHRENQVGEYIRDRGKGEGYTQGIPFFCYWLDVLESKGSKHKQDGGARGGYPKWFSEQYLPSIKNVSALEAALDLTPQTV